MVAKETSNSESLACVEECLRRKFDQDAQYYKDQISRLEATVAAHHERLGRVLKASRRTKQQQQQQQQGTRTALRVFLCFSFFSNFQLFVISFRFSFAVSGLLSLP